MNRADWLALAADCDAEVKRYRASGNTDSARLWQQYSRAARDAANQAEPWWTSIEQEQSNEPSLNARTTNAD